MQVIASAVIVENNKVLIGKRIDDPNHPAGLGGKWHFPGGRLEEGETPEKCVKREIKEETNLDIEIINSLGDSWRKKAAHLFWFLCKAENKGEEKPMDDLAEIKWVEREDVIKSLDKEVIVLLSEYVKNYLEF